MTIKEKLKAELKKAGLNEGLADVINITSEDQIEGVITQLKSTQKSTENELDFSKVLGSEEFSKFVKENGLENTLKHSKVLQGLTDKKVDKGIDTALKKMGLKLDPDGGENDPKPGDGDSETLKLIKALSAKIDGLEKNNQNADKLEKAKEALEKSNIPKEFHEKMLGRYDLESDTSFEDQTKALETELTAYQQFFVGDSSGKGLPMGGGLDSEKETLKEIEEMGKAFVEKHKKN